jgi:hypothetical protein
MNALSRSCPKAYKELQKCLHKDLEKGVYTSQYRRWNGRLGSHCIVLTAATQKAFIDDDFKTTLLELEF